MPKQDQKEADIITLAGQAGSITVATNMAGRGTDIELGNNIIESGGLHVIATSRNTSIRIDRQLYGRCARQGDPGSTEAILSLTNEKLENFYPATILRLVAKFAITTRINTNLAQQAYFKISAKMAGASRFPHS